MKKVDGCEHMGGYERTVFVLITAHELCQKLESSLFFTLHGHAKYDIDTDFFGLITVRVHVRVHQKNPTLHPL